MKRVVLLLVVLAGAFVPPVAAAAARRHQPQRHRDRSGPHRQHHHSRHRDHAASLARLSAQPSSCGTSSIPGYGNVGPWCFYTLRVADGNGTMQTPALLITQDASGVTYTAPIPAGAFVGVFVTAQYVLSPAPPLPEPPVPFAMGSSTADQVSWTVRAAYDGTVGAPVILTP